MSIDLRARPQMIWWFALLAGTSYFIADRLAFASADMVAWKGASVGLLALWAARHADDAEGWAIATILAAGATGDVLIATHGLVIAAIPFVIGHLLAVALFARARWRRGWPSVVGGAVAVASIGYALTGMPGVAVYALALGAMAGAAALGRFGPRVIAGAGLFVLSDLLLFARIGPLSGSPIPGWLVWSTYFAGQALIAWGVVSTLVQERAR